jgi:hypothetical protein
LIFRGSQADKLIAILRADHQALAIRYYDLLYENDALLAKYQGLEEEYDMLKISNPKSEN